MSFLTLDATKSLKNYNELLRKQVKVSPTTYKGGRYFTIDDHYRISFKDLIHQANHLANNIVSTRLFTNEERTDLRNICDILKVLDDTATAQINNAKQSSILIHRISITIFTFLRHLLGNILPKLWGKGFNKRHEFKILNDFAAKAKPPEEKPTKKPTRISLDALNLSNNQTPRKTRPRSLSDTKGVEVIATFKKPAPVTKSSKTKERVSPEALNLEGHHPQNPRPRSLSDTTNIQVIKPFQKPTPTPQAKPKPTEVTIPSAVIAQPVHHETQASEIQQETPKVETPAPKTPEKTSLTVGDRFKNWTKAAQGKVSNLRTLLQKKPST